MPPKSPGAGCGDALHNKGDASKKMKRTRLVLDSRIELTDEELRVCARDILCLSHSFKAASAGRPYALLGRTRYDPSWIADQET